MTTPAATPQEWLKTFEAFVRARAFAGGRTLFAPDAVAFGTWARAVAGLDNIVREQWENVWPRIRDFHFEPGAHRQGARAVAGCDKIVREQWENVWPRIRDFHFEPGAHVHTAGDSAWIAGAWLTEVTGPEGRPFTRPGRGTFVLERRGGKWLAVHSHFSLLPSQSESAHGRLPGAKS